MLLTRIKTALRTSPPGSLLRLHRRYLRDSGWNRSAATGRPQDVNGEPIPWITFPALSLLDARVRGDLRVFEYGCGESTLWWAGRVAQVVACEHDVGWATEVSARVPLNVQVLRHDRGSEAYPSAATEHGMFDVVVIDGMRRNDCAPFALRALTERGVVLWDNSERPRYEPGMAVLTDAGFRRLDLHGHGPVNAYAWCTSIFYRDGNCLGL